MDYLESIIYTTASLPPFDEVVEVRRVGVRRFTLLKPGVYQIVNQTNNYSGDKLVIRPIPKRFFGDKFFFQSKGNRTAKLRRYSIDEMVAAEVLSNDLPSNVLHIVHVSEPETVTSSSVATTAVATTSGSPTGIVDSTSLASSDKSMEVEKTTEFNKDMGFWKLATLLAITLGKKATTMTSGPTKSFGFRPLPWPTNCRTAPSPLQAISSSAGTSRPTSEIAPTICHCHYPLQVPEVRVCS